MRVQTKRTAAGVERWRDIPGFEGRYQASTEGRIRKAWPGARKPLILSMSRNHRDDKSLYVKLYDGSRFKSHRVLQLVAKTWLTVPKGCQVIHKNGLHSDNSLRNVAIMTFEEVGRKINARHASRPVVMIDRAGEIVECYSSSIHAAKTALMCVKSIRNRCNGLVKNEFDLTGYSYRWDDEE